MQVNQRGDPVVEETIDAGWEFQPHEVEQALILLAEKLGYKFVRTNATKYGNTVIQLREIEK